MAIIIFGGAGGLGSALTRQLREAGREVVVAGRTAATVERVAANAGAVPATVDATDFDAVDALVERVAGTPGGVEGVVNCVGSLVLKPAHLTRQAEWDDAVAANLTSAFAAVRAGARAMRDAGGSIVLVSSAAAQVGLPNHEAIAAAKAGVEGLARAAAATYGAAGVRVNVVAPGLVRTPLTKRITGSETARAASERLHVLGRIGEADEVARMIAWLLAPEQTWVTGQVFGVDGGLARVRPPTAMAAD